LLLARQAAPNTGEKTGAFADDSLITTKVKSTWRLTRT